MYQKTITFTDSGPDGIEKKYRIVVQRATVGMGARRWDLQREGDKIEDESYATHALRVTTWPSIVAATVEFEGAEWPMTFESFLDLPEMLWDAWTEAVREVNPYWYGGEVAPDPKAESPPAMNSISG